ncbi:hypothetical protein ABGB17_19035 [Sphaerisporangium sp. B11E5]|uniref:hypothetical protein n=1 Tax=Sphaerisporangium sp. B11E5 TaxID=3153563 RepID=UPI00325D8903
MQSPKVEDLDLRLDDEHMRICGKGGSVRTVPPAEPFTAHWRKRRLPPGGRAFDRQDVLRLHGLTRELIPR